MKKGFLPQLEVIEIYGAANKAFWKSDLSSTVVKKERKKLGARWTEEPPANHGLHGLGVLRRGGGSAFEVQAAAGGGGGSTRRESLFSGDGEGGGVRRRGGEEEGEEGGGV